MALLKKQPERDFGFALGRVPIVSGIYNSHLGYESYERSGNTDYRNGTKPKTLRSSVGGIPSSVPQDRDSDFEPKVVPKYKKDISDIESKIISLSAKGLTTRQVSSVIEDIYGVEVSDGMISDIMNVP